jgi:D-cysteine desulfhydrase
MSQSISALPRLQLAQLPTPLAAAPQLIPTLLGIPGPTLYVKRDDLSGTELTGNKVRKLELLLAEARARGADTVLTCGGAQSNHCRATALAAAQVGLRCQLLLRVAEPAEPPPLTGNLLLAALAGAQIRFISPADYQNRTALLAERVAELRTQGKTGYAIPEGGSNALGSLGYVRCIEELRAQIPEPERPLTIVHAAGSGGTGAGLLLGIALCSLPWRVAAVNVCDDRAYFVRRVREILDEAATRFGLPAAARLSAAGESVIDIRDGYVGRGYALSQPEELRLIAAACRTQGLVLDPVYTGKALRGLLEELRADAMTFGERVVFVHTGGIYGLLAQAEELAAVVAAP